MIQTRLPHPIWWYTDQPQAAYQHIGCGNRHSLEPFFKFSYKFIFSTKTTQNFNDIKWQNLVFSHIKFENLHKLEYNANNFGLFSHIFCDHGQLPMTKSKCNHTLPPRITYTYVCNGKK